MGKFTKEIEGVVERFNNTIKSDKKIKVCHRNGYTCIDFVNSGNCFSAGMTDKECLNILYIMCKTLTDFN